MPPTGPRLRLLVTALGLCLAATLAAGLALGGVESGLADQAVVDGDVQPRVVQEANSSNSLQPERDDATRDAIAYQDVDVGIAVASGAEALHGRHDRLAFSERFQNAPNESAQLETFRTAVADLARRTSEIRTARTEARTAFREGTITASEYFRRLALLDAATDRLAAQRNRLEERVGEVGPRAQSSLTQLQNLEADIETMNGPVTAELRARYAGNASAGATLLSVTGDGGFVAATTTDERFYRVAQESADWSRDGVDRFPTAGGSGGLSQALDRAADLYPWTFSHQFGSPPPRGVFGTTVLYKIAVIHQHGELTVYLDGSTESVFREVQQNRLNAIPWNWSRSATANGVELTVNGTSPSGPLDVRLTDATSDDGVDGRIRIEDTYVGSTEATGRFRTVQPYGAFTVNATTPANETVTLTIPANTS